MDQNTFKKVKCSSLTKFEISFIEREKSEFWIKWRKVWFF
jgi:hypothetical protein